MRKVYVEVYARFTPDGTIFPYLFIWENGHQYEIDRISDIRKAASLKAGGFGTRYTIYVCGKQTYMWLDDNGRQWFMEGK